VHLCVCVCVRACPECVHHRILILKVKKKVIYNDSDVSCAEGNLTLSAVYSNHLHT
jgi:hypothetical protein